MTDGPPPLTFDDDHDLFAVPAKAPEPKPIPVTSFPAVIDAPPNLPKELKARGRATAAEMVKWADQMHKEGRSLFSTALKEAAETMRLLAR